MEEINQGLLVSLGYIRSKPKALKVCLCQKCLSSFYDANKYIVRRKNPYQVIKGDCTYEQSPFTLTDYGFPDEKFGLIIIPKIDLEMPLFLGASEENMAAGAAVLSQTSIPIGGDSTNAVIAGHRGWNGYPYFLDIEKLEVGDQIHIVNVWGELIYEVSEIKIVNPNDVSAILIQPGRDLITLLTCHPPNTGGRYRYLVYCERAVE